MKKINLPKQIIQLQVGFPVIPNNIRRSVYAFCRGIKFETTHSIILKGCRKEMAEITSRTITRSEWM